MSESAVDTSIDGSSQSPTASLHREAALLRYGRESVAAAALGSVLSDYNLGNTDAGAAAAVATVDDKHDPYQFDDEENPSCEVCQCET